MDFDPNNHSLFLVETLCKAINMNINYCHWKSNNALDRSASGKNDLDLLVDRKDSQKFLEILFKLGFKETISPRDFIMPGVHLYYGYDESANIFVNVHAHLQLILGHDLTKNYHLPIELPFLNSSKRGFLFNVPSPEFELLVFVIRMVIKHFNWVALILRQGKLSASEIRELDYLFQRTSLPELDKILTEHLPNIDQNVFQNCLQTLQPGNSVLKRVKVGQKLIKNLQPYSRHSLLSDVGVKLFRRVAWPLQTRILRKEARRKLSSGGLMIAVVGGDGAGKTTVVEGLNQWLDKDFSVRKFHLGKPKWSFNTIIGRGILKLGRSLGFYPFQREEIKYTNDMNILEFPGYPWAIREVFTARDRYINYKKARDFASNGGLVILDRFPLPQIKFMDRPQIARMTTGIFRNRLIKFLIKMEENYYLKISPPDLLVVLKADPEIAVQRKIDEKAEEVRARSTEIWEINWKETTAFVIDANLPKEKVLSEIKRLIWSHL